MAVNATAGLAIGAAVGNGNVGAISAAANTDWNNRQLHPDEMKWIKENAKRFAKEQGIDEKTAEARLITQAAQEVDYAWKQMINTHDQAALNFLYGASRSEYPNGVPLALGETPAFFINENGEKQKLFSATKDEYYSTGKYSDLAAQYDKANNQVLTKTLIPEIQNNLIVKSGQDTLDGLSYAGRSLFNNPLDTAKTMTQNMAYSASECTKSPSSCIDEKWSTLTNASKDIAHTHYKQSDVNYLYGKDMSVETALIPLVRGGSVVAEAVPVAKAGGMISKEISSLSQKLPIIGKTVGYENQITRISNPYSIYLEKDKYGNEIYYRSLSEKDYKHLLLEGKIPSTSETFVSPLAEYSKQYNGILVRFYTNPGTSISLQDIGVVGNSATKREVFPSMERAQKGWATRNQVLFKLEGRNNSMNINNGKGVVNTGLGKTEGLDIFNENIIKFEKIEK
ncbi:hypothetical protein [Avibacterium paragallinarum]|uniref:Toxin CdiA n=1 Tax=Avibacterium paragallinarum TaxID=728 RepID=A0ABU7QLD9_AVIPA|nr:hypothetical protein [Avibacterium paragallinarum]MEE3609772.1 hypothetical protein [Avibacterium paragallinarum]MEE3622320.1 hypothetical protein [Avibacterium paragallinarum]MEE3669778.1 hypothetical protein [Avibacterium paragallinarum]MEE3681945.1 hypothetical protein [Avibacterium paragallinarum]MEE4387071.1 hypothetical protein [Avibacterium paragallinarum]